MGFEREDRLAILRTEATSYVEVAIRTATTEYPHFPYFIATGPESYRLHREFHPAFFGSFDWHSCVEMHLVAVRLMRLFPDETAQTSARAALSELLTADHLQQELEFFRSPANTSLERPYGWGWLMMLAAELEEWDDPDAIAWSRAVEPLAQHLMDSLIHWLPKLTYPQRTGVHPNTAFSLINALHYARCHEERGWTAIIRYQALRFFADDVDYPFQYEPSGSDFLSAGLCEAVLMHDVLDPDSFDAWIGRFVPGGLSQLGDVLTPVTVSDPSDGQLAHLHGLNLSRAWAFVRLAEHCNSGSEERGNLLELARRHAEVSLPAVSGSDYMVEHWLAVYAMLLLTA